MDSCVHRPGPLCIFWVYTGCGAAEVEVTWVFHCFVSGAVRDTWSCEQIGSTELDPMVASASAHPVATDSPSADSGS